MFLAIVPARNEVKTVSNVVRDLLAHVDRALVVDDGSTDATVQAAKNAGAIILSHGINRGQGAALETGHEYARAIGADLVLHFDADGQFSSDDIAPAVAAMKKAGADVLFGSRFFGKKANLPFIKKYVIVPIAYLLNRFIFRIPLRDTHNGFRLLNKRALEKIRITQDRMAHATEIPVLAKKQGLAFIEFPVSVTYGRHGQGMLDGIRVMADLFTGQLLKK